MFKRALLLMLLLCFMFSLCLSKTPFSATEYKKWLKQAIEKEIGTKSNFGNVPKISYIKFSNNDIAKPIIGIVANDNLTKGLIRDGMLSDAYSIFKIVFADKRAKEVKVEILAPMVDIYGKESWEVVMVFKMTRKTAQKINWSKWLVVTKNLPLVVDYFYERPDW